MYWIRSAERGFTILGECVFSRCVITFHQDTHDCGDHLGSVARNVQITEDLLRDSANDWTTHTRTRRHVAHVIRCAHDVLVHSGRFVGGCDAGTGGTDGRPTVTVYFIVIAVVCTVVGVVGGDNPKLTYLTHSRAIGCVCMCNVCECVCAMQDP